MDWLRTTVGEAEEVAEENMTVEKARSTGGDEDGRRAGGDLMDRGGGVWMMAFADERLGKPQSRVASNYPMPTNPCIR